VENAAQPVLPSAEVASGAQQTQPQPAGGGKKEKERQRKERQRQRRMDEAKEALQVAIEAMLDARCVSPLWLRCIGRFPGEVVASMCGWQGALTCGGVCGCSGESKLSAVEEATAEAAEAAERLQMEERTAALALRVQGDMLELQQMRAQLGVPPAAPAPHPDAEETMCVVCFDAPKDHLIVPCGHQCVCAGCAEQLTKTRTPTCPVCREPIQQTVKVFCS
jgi:hypothetical protein